jgi:hypothetical protein
MDLRNLITEKKVDLERLAKDLDELGHPGRVWAVHQWTKGIQARLYEAAKGFRKITLEDFVPEGVGPLVEVIHEGKNTLPAHTHFQKRFCKPKDESKKDALWGYNHQSLAGITGPGYFVTHLAGDEGEVDIDYTMIPPEKPEAWPGIAPAGTRFGRFVYHGMVDVMRGISKNVSIGRARKAKGWMDAWFILVREDRAAQDIAA